MQNYKKKEIKNINFIYKIWTFTYGSLNIKKNKNIEHKKIWSGTLGQKRMNVSGQLWELGWENGEWNGVGDEEERNGYDFGEMGESVLRRESEEYFWSLFSCSALANIEVPFIGKYIVGYVVRRNVTNSERWIVKASLSGFSL